ncbi:hypothetical protein EVAR_16150_1 [Eumeta japonica]|uniref:Uncharacterized protein n=1 Tax=Eumeta variegata TaxID=151549 RepID=A0A4C1WBP7_EUMVA|nr:hypothetical protein EVAR_16150_1 [Eumeta japonica]
MLDISPLWCERSDESAPLILRLGHADFQENSLDGCVVPSFKQSNESSSTKERQENASSSLVSSLMCATTPPGLRTNSNALLTSSRPTKYQVQPRYAHATAPVLPQFIRYDATRASARVADAEL